MLPSSYPKSPRRLLVPIPWKPTDSSYFPKSNYGLCPVTVGGKFSQGTGSDKWEHRRENHRLSPQRQPACLLSRKSWTHHQPLHHLHRHQILNITTPWRPQNHFFFGSFRITLLNKEVKLFYKETLAKNGVKMDLIPAPGNCSIL